jgi:transposase-like protein
MTKARTFRGFRFPAEVISWAVHWYLRFPLGYRDLKLLLADHGVAADHVTLYRWAQRLHRNPRGGRAGIAGSAAGHARHADETQIPLAK